MGAAFALAGALADSAAQAQTPAEALYQKLLTPDPRVLQGPLAASKTGAMPVSEEDKAAGVVGAVEIAFPDKNPKAHLLFVVFANSGDAIAYNNKHLGLPPRAGALLAFPPFAQCADLLDRGYCDMVVQDDAVALVAISTRVAQDAEVLIGLGFRHLQNVKATAATAPAPPNPGSIDACALATKADIEAALNAPVGPPQRDRVGNCNWGSMRIAGDGVTIQPLDGGRAKFLFDKGRTRGPVMLPGIGDDAFGFVSMAGFVQLNVLRHERYVAVILQSQHDPARLEKAKALATKIAGRM